MKKKKICVIRQTLRKRVNLAFRESEGAVRDRAAI